MSASDDTGGADQGASITADWEADTRSIADCLPAWEAAHDWSGAEAARQLRVPYLTYRDWRTGRRKPSPEGAIRRLMTLIDASVREAHGWP